MVRCLFLTSVRLPLTGPTGESFLEPQPYLCRRYGEGQVQLPGLCAPDLGLPAGSFPLLTHQPESLGLVWIPECRCLPGPGGHLPTMHLDTMQSLLAHDGVPSISYRGSLHHPDLPQRTDLYSETVPFLAFWCYNVLSFKVTFDGNCPLAQL